MTENVYTNSRQDDRTTDRRIDGQSNPDTHKHGQKKYGKCEFNLYKVFEVHEKEGLATGPTLFLYFLYNLEKYLKIFKGFLQLSVILHLVP